MLILELFGVGGAVPPKSYFLETVFEQYTAVH